MLQQGPVSLEFLPVQFCPPFDQALLAPGQASRNLFRRSDAVDGDILLIIRVEVRQMMRRVGLGEHANDDSEKATQLWHGSILT